MKPLFVVIVIALILIDLLLIVVSDDIRITGSYNSEKLQHKLTIMKDITSTTIIILLVLLAFF